MTTWKDGGHYGRVCREITNENGTRIICAVWIKRYSPGKRDMEPWPEGEANFGLILQAPQMLEALEAIAEGAIVSPDQSPGGIAESVLRVLQLVREQNLEYLLLISAQQKRAERAETALEAIVKLGGWMEEKEVVCNRMEEIATAAIAAVKGENDDSIS